MKDNIITIKENEIEEEYKLLLIINKEYQYIIYTNMDNPNINENLYVAKIDPKSNITLPIKEDEWQMIEEEYSKIIKTNEN